MRFEVIWFSSHYRPPLRPSISNIVAEKSANTYAEEKWSCPWSRDTQRQVLYISIYFLTMEFNFGNPCIIFVWRNMLGVCQFPIYSCTNRERLWGFCKCLIPFFLFFPPSRNMLAPIRWVSTKFSMNSRPDSEGLGFTPHVWLHRNPDDPNRENNQSSRAPTCLGD